MPKSEKNNVLIKELFDKYNLYYNPENPEDRDNDVYVHKHYTLISRSGIDKIEKACNIKIEFSYIQSGIDFCVVKASGSYTSSQGIHSMETLASANPTTCKNGYYAEIAEKRVRSRLILKLVGLYELGIYGSDEMTESTAPAAAATPAVVKKTLFTTNNG